MKDYFLCKYSVPNIGILYDTHIFIQENTEKSSDYIVGSVDQENIFCSLHQSVEILNFPPFLLVILTDLKQRSFDL